MNDKDNEFNYSKVFVNEQYRQRVKNVLSYGRIGKYGRRNGEKKA